MPEEIQDYFRSTASQMKARLDIIKGVVIQGRERNVPVGDACENALRSVLRDSLPARFGVATGLVYTGEIPPGVVQSKPLDVIIFDALHYAPIYRDGDFVVVPFDALLGVIEVKEVLRHEQFVVACEQLHSVLEQERGPKELAPSGYVLGFLGVTGRTAKGWEKTNVSEFIKEICVLEQDWCLSRSAVDGKFHLFSRDGWYYFYWRLVRQIYDRVLRRERAAWKYPVPEEVLQIPEEGLQT
jgi:hypothetical protein